jgi:hypothetical protein
MDPALALLTDARETTSGGGMAVFSVFLRREDLVAQLEILIAA